MDEYFGKYIKVITTTKEDVFGTVVYKITDKTVMTKDGIKVRCDMLGGTGPAARKNYFVYDLISSIEQNIKNKKTVIISEEEAMDFVRKCEK